MPNRGHRTDKSGDAASGDLRVSDGLVSNTRWSWALQAPVWAVRQFCSRLRRALAGAFSMAAGEYVSVASQTDLFRRELRLEAQELEEKPLEETAGTGVDLSGQRAGREHRPG